MLRAYSAIMGAAKMHMFITSGVGADDRGNDENDEDGVAEIFPHETRA